MHPWKTCTRHGGYGGHVTRPSEPPPTTSNSVAPSSPSATHHLTHITGEPQSPRVVRGAPRRRDTMSPRRTTSSAHRRGGRASRDSSRLPCHYSRQPTSHWRHGTASM